MGNIIERPKDLDTCAAHIRSAQHVQRKNFIAFIKAVGDQLEKAQRLLADHKAGFGNWVKDEFGWSHQQAIRLISAASIVRIIEPIGSIKNLPLPDSESQCRSLSSIPKDKVVLAWEQACEASPQAGFPPTAAIIKAVCDDIQPPKKRAATTRAAKSSDVTNPDQMLDEISYYAVSFLSDCPERAGDLEVLLLTWVSRCKQR